MLFAAGKPDEAIGAYRKAIDLSPHYVDAVNNLAAALESKHEWEEALQLYQQALTLTPNSLDIRMNYAAALQRAKRNEEAITNYRQIVSARPTDAHALFELGSLLYLEGQLDEAIANLEKSLALDSNQPEAEFTLARAFQDQTSFRMRSMPTSGASLFTPMMRMRSTIWAMRAWPTATRLKRRIRFVKRLRFSRTSPRRFRAWERR